MGNIIKDMELFNMTTEGVVGGNSFYIWTEGRENCLKLEDFIHKLGYWYRNNDKIKEYGYLLPKHTQITEVTFYEFNKTDQTFTASGSLVEKTGLKLIYPDDKNHIERLLKHTPSYTPRKIDCTLESKSNYMYDRCVFVANDVLENTEIQEELFKLGYRWSVTGKNVLMFNTYPQYIFISSIYGSDKHLTHMSFGENQMYRNIEEYISLKNKENGQNICRAVFGHKDVSKLDSILRYGMVEPSYKPKRTTRTLESLNESFVFCSTNEDVKRRISVKLPYGIGDIVYFNREAVDLQTKAFARIGLQVSMSELEWIRKHIMEKLVINEIAFELDDHVLFLSVSVENGTSGSIYVSPYTLEKPRPSYRPRRTERTLEGVDGRYYNLIQKELTPHKYRFKTEEEFKKEFKKEDNYYRSGYSEQRWRGFFNFNEEGQMDYLLGRDFPYGTDDMSDSFDIVYPGCHDSSHWFIDMNMLTPNMVSPSYKPKRTERTLESVNPNFHTASRPFQIECGVKMLPKVEEYLLKNTDVRWSSNGKNVFLNYRKDLWEHLKMVYFIIRENGIMTWGAVPYFNGTRILKIYNDNEFKTVFNIAPSYKPKRIERTLESLDLKEYGKEVSILIQSESHNEMIQKELFSRGYAWGGEKIVRKLIPGNILTYYPKEKEIVWIDDKEGYDKFIKQGWRTNPIIIDSIKLFIPSYQPRKVERTLENFQNKWKHKYLTIKSENEDESVRIQNFLFDLGLQWSHGKRVLLENRYPCYYVLFLDDRNSQLTHTNDMNFFNRYVSDSQMDPHLYSIRDLSTLRMILKDGMVAPSYHPKRTDRTLEGLEQPKYRLKTQEEFEKEFGPDWRESVDLYWTMGMDSYFGMEVTNRVKKDNDPDSRVAFCMGGYNFSWEMITEIKPIVPSYRPRKTDRSI
jgi:hypothetical protein